MFITNFWNTISRKFPYWGKKTIRQSEIAEVHDM